MKIRLRKIMLVICLTALCLFTSGVTYALSVGWVGIGDGKSWSDKDNWAPAQVPSTNDDVIISGFVVTYDGGGTGTIRSLDCIGTLLVQASLTVQQASSVSGDLTIMGGRIKFDGKSTLLNVHLQSGSLGGSGELTIGDTLYWTGGTITGSNAVTVTKALVISGAAEKKLWSRFLWNKGSGNWSGTGNLVISGNATFYNDAILSLQDDHTMYNNSTNSTGSFVNHGTLTVASDHTTEISLDNFEDNGVIEANQGTLNIHSPGTLNFATFKVALGASVLLNGRLTVWNILSGNIQGTLKLTSSLRIPAAGAEFNFTGNGFEWGGGATGIVNEDSQHPGTLTNRGLILITGGASTASRSLWGPTLVNEGTIRWTGEQALKIAGNALVENRGTFDIQTTNTVWITTGSSSGQFKNVGILKKSAGTGTTFMEPSVFEDVGGTIDAQKGTLMLDSSSTTLTNSTLTAGSGASLKLNARCVINGKLQGAPTGNVELGDHGSLRIPATGATLAFTGTGFQWDGYASSIVSDDKSNRGTLTNEGLFRLLGPAGNDSRALFNATLVNLGSATIRWEGQHDLEIYGGGVLQNWGTFDIQTTGDVFLYNPSNTSSGTFSNIGTVEKTAGSGSTIFSVDGFDNINGTIDVKVGEVEIRGYSDKLNGATLNTAAGATLTLSGTYIVRGTLQGASAGTLQMTSPGRFRVEPVGATFNFTQNGLELGGDYWWIGSDDSQNPATLTNQGLVRITGPASTASRSFSNQLKFVNQGTVRWTGAQSLQITGGATFENPGIFDVQTLGDVNLYNPNSSSGMFDNSGTFKKSSGTGTLTYSIGVFRNSGGTINVQAGILDLHPSAGVLNGGTLTTGQTGTLLFSGTFELSGTLSGNIAGRFAAESGTTKVVPAGATFNFTGNGFEWGSYHRITSKDTSQPGKLTNLGVLVLVGNQSAPRRLNAVTLANAGMVRWTGRSLLNLDSAALFDNRPSGTFEIQTDSWIYHDTGQTGVFDNAGTVVKKQTVTSGVDVTGTTAFFVPFNNKGGTLDVQKGTIEVKGGGTSTSGSGGVETAFKASSGAEILFSKNYTNQGRCSLSGDGIKRLSGITFRNESTLTWRDAGDLYLDGSNSLFDNPAGSIFDIQSTGKLMGTGKVHNGGTLRRSSGAGVGTVEVQVLNDSATIDIKAGELVLNGGGTLSNSTLNVTSSATLTMHKVWQFSGSITGDVRGSAILQGEEGIAAIVTGSGELKIAQGGVTLNIAGNGLTLDTVLVQGTPLTNRSSLWITGFLIFDAVELRNQGALTWRDRSGGQGVIWLNGNSVIDNQANAVFNIEPQAHDLFVSNDGNSNWHVDNAGTVALKAKVASQTCGLNTFNNKGGTIDVQSGGLSLLLGDHQGGTFNVTKDGSLEFEAGDHQFTGMFQGNVAEGGKLLIQPSSSAAQGDIQPSVKIGQTGAVFDVKGAGVSWSTWSLAVPTLKGGPLTNRGKLKVYSADAGATFAISQVTNEGTVMFESGTAKFPGGYVQTIGSTLLNDGNLESALPVDIQGGLLGGKGTVTGNVLNGGNVTPGLSPGILQIVGDYTQKAGGKLSIELGGDSPGTGYDRLNITGAANLDGMLDVLLFGTFIPASGQSFQVMTFGSRSGDFSAKNGLEFGSLMKLTPVYDATTLMLKNAQLVADLTPATARKLVGNTHTLTCSLTEDDSLLSGETVNFEVTAGPNAGTKGTGTTSIWGTATFSYTSNGKPGTDTIQASGTVGERLFSATATVEWFDIMASLTPATAKLLPGTQHSVTLTLLKSGQPAPGIAVQFRVTSGPHVGEQATATTNASGQASFSYTGATEGTDSILAAATVDGFSLEQTATVEWKRRQFDLALTKVGLSGDSPVDANTHLKLGDPISYTLILTNNGPETAQGVSIFDTWSPKLEFQSADTTQGTCTFDSALGTVTCDLGDLPAGSSATMHVFAKVKGAGTVTNEATATYDIIEQNDTNLQNDKAQVSFIADKKQIALKTTKVGLIGDTIVGDKVMVKVGETIGFTVLVENGGPDTAERVVLKDAMTPGLDYVSATTSQGTVQYQTADRTLVGNLGNIGPGQTVTVQVVAKATRAGTSANGALLEYDSAIFEELSPGDEGAIVTLTIKRELYGDVTGDRQVTSSDARLILQIVTGKRSLNDPNFPALTLQRADVSGDGTVTASDAALLLMYYSGKLTKFPAEK